MNPPMVQLVSATRLEEAAFWSDTLLGRSLRQPQHRQLLARIHFANRQPLAVAYNAAIEAAPAKAAGTIPSSAVPYAKVRPRAATGMCTDRCRCRCNCSMGCFWRPEPTH